MFHQKILHLYLQFGFQIQKLRDDPSLFENLPDELLRYDGTAQMAARYTSDEVEVVMGDPLQRGQQVEVSALPFDNIEYLRVYAVQRL